MDYWKKTSCVLCGVNCGLEVMTEGSRITKVRGDRESPLARLFLPKGRQRSLFSE